MDRQQKTLFMIAILLLLIVPGLAGYTQPAQAAPCNVAGLIQTNTTWSPASCDPYIVTGNVIIDNNTRLTIQPGTNIKFNSGMGLTVRGELVARGTANNRITFTSNQSSKAPGDWKGILLENSTVDAIVNNLNYVSGSIIQYATIEYANIGIELDTAYPFVENNTIRFNHRGLHAERILGDSQDILTISNNSITDNGLETGDGITRGGGIYSDRVQLRISQNTISRNRATQSGGGIHINGAYGDNNILDGNLIENNNVPPYYFNAGGGGVFLFNGGSNIEAYNNTIQGNSATGSVGGGIFFSGMIPRNIHDNVIRNNTAKQGGGFYFSLVSVNAYPVQVVNNMITNNTAIEKGGGIYSHTPNRDNVFTFAYNDIYGNIGNGQPNDFTTHNTESFREDIIAINNWWGTTNRTTIENHITHAVDNANLGLVIFEPFCTAPCEPVLPRTTVYLPILAKNLSSTTPPLPTPTSLPATPTSTATALPPTSTTTPTATPTIPPTATPTSQPGPPNDDFNTPLLISNMPYTNVQDTSHATTANDDPLLTCYSGQGNRSVWYRYIPTSSGRLSVNTFGSDYDTVLAIWTGTRGNLTAVDCNDDASGLQSELLVPVQAGTTYFIEITGFDNATGILNLRADFTNAPAITDLQLRYDTASGLVVIYQDVFFYDPNGDATIIDWELLSVVGGNPDDITITDGTISIPPVQQRAGAVVTGAFTCPADFTGRLNMDVTLEDASAQRSNTISYSMDCSNPYP